MDMGANLCLRGPLRNLTNMTIAKDDFKGSGELSTPSSSLLSSSPLSGPGFMVERQHRLHVDRPLGITKHHALWLYLRPFVGEYASERGFVRFSKPPNSITVTPVGILPALYSKMVSNPIVCTFEASFMETLRSELDRVPTSTPFFRAGFQHRTIQQLMCLLAAEAQAGGPSGRLYSDSLSYALATQFLFLSQYSDFLPSHPRISSLPKPSLRRVLERIEEGLRADLNLDSLAREAGYSRGHFIKMFRLAMGVTPYRYLLQRRIDRAKSQLKARDKSIIDIAADGGFASQAHMTDVFRKQVGVPPGEFRRLL